MIKVASKMVAQAKGHKLLLVWCHLCDDRKCVDPLIYWLVFELKPIALHNIFVEQIYLYVTFVTFQQ